MGTESGSCTQWLGPDFREEKSFDHFQNLSKNSTCTIQYNGDRFDQPYLEERCRKMSFRLHLKDSPQSISIRYLNPVKVF